jgi:hypothetical protein
VKITQVFKSSSDDVELNRIEIGEADQAAPIPVGGDNVRWFVKDKVYSGRVRSRLISYSAPNNIGLDRSDEVEVTVELSVEVVER